MTVPRGAWTTVSATRSIWPATSCPRLRSAPGEDLPVTLYWRADAPVDTGYTVFVHLLDDADALRAQRDTIPADGTRPTPGWLPGEVISDTLVLPTPADAATSTYRVAVGMYRALDGGGCP